MHQIFSTVLRGERLHSITKFILVKSNIQFGNRTWTAWRLNRWNVHKTPIQQRLLWRKSEKSDFVMIFVDNEFKMKWNWNVVGPLFWQIFYTVQPNMIVWGAAEKKQLIIDWQRIHCIWLQLPQQKVLISIWKLHTKFTRKSVEVQHFSEHCGFTNYTITFQWFFQVFMNKFTHTFLRCFGKPNNFCKHFY